MSEQSGQVVERAEPAAGERKRAKRRSAEQMADDKIQRIEEELAVARAAKAALAMAKEDDETLASASATLGRALLDQCAAGEKEALTMLTRIVTRSPKAAPTVAKVQGILAKRAKDKQPEDPAGLKSEPKPQGADGAA